MEPTMRCRNKGWEQQAGPLRFQGVATDDAASVGDRENGSFVGAARELQENGARVVGQAPPKKGAGAECVEFEAETVLFAVGIPLDKLSAGRRRDRGR
jgi:hypothetical protein